MLSLRIVSCLKTVLRQFSPCLGLGLAVYVFGIYWHDMAYLCWKCR